MTFFRAFVCMLSITALSLHAGSLMNISWGNRVRGGAVGRVTATPQQITVQRGNSEGEIILLANQTIPAETGAGYRLRADITGPVGGQIVMQAPPAGGPRRTYPTTGYVETNGTKQTVSIDFAMINGENGFGVTIYFNKPGVYTVTDFAFEKISDPRPANDVLANPWIHHIRGGAEGEVKITPDEIIARRDNDKGEVIVLTDKPFPAEQGASYRVTATITGPAGGRLIMQAPPGGGAPRTFPSTGYVNTNGKEQQFAVNLDMIGKEDQIGVVFYFVQQGTYRISSVTIDKTADPIFPQLLTADDEILNSRWRTSFAGNGAGVFDYEQGKFLKVENFTSFGVGIASSIDNVKVKPDTKYRLLVGVSGGNTNSFRVQVTGEKNREQSMGCNSSFDLLSFDFTTEKNENEIGLTFLFNIGKFNISTIKLIEVDEKEEAMIDQREFMVLWRSGDAPETTARFSENFRMENGRFYGKAAVLLKNAFPSRKIVFESAYTSADGVKAEIVARDIHHRELLRAPISEKGVVLPELATFVYLELTAPDNGAEYKELTIREYVNDPESFHWGRWNSFEIGNTSDAPSQYRRKFTLDKLPVGAIGRFCTPGEVVVNGTSFGNSRSGDTTLYYRNILPVLKLGENEIMINLPAPLPQSLQVDVLLGFDDSTHMVLRSDDGSWEMKEYDSDTWKRATVRKSTYLRTAYSQRWIAPGEIPDTVVPKVDFTGQAQFASSELYEQKRLQTALDIDLQNWLFLGANRFDIHVVNSEGKRCWRQTVFGGELDLVKGVNGKLHFDFDLCTEFLPVGEYHLETPEFLVGKIDGTFSVTKAYEPKTDFFIDYSNHLPMLNVNGELIPVTIYRNYGRYKIGHEKFFLQDFWHSANAGGGVKIANIYAEMGPDVHKNADVRMGEMWTGPEEYHFELLDFIMENIFAVNPDTLLMINVGIDAPQWYLKAYPDTRAILHTGDPSIGVSWASARWRKDSVAAVHAMMDHIADKPYSSKIIGIYFSGGYDGQWWHHLDWKFPFKATDYHPDMLARFRDYLRKIYDNDEEQLRAAWHNNEVTFDTAEMPTFEQRRGKGYYTDPATTDGRMVIDYIEAQADSLKTHLEELFEATKINNPQILAGSYYVPTWDCSYRWGQIQRQMTDTMFDSPVYDFGATPMDYLYRNPDEIGISQFGVNQFYRVNRKLYLFEDDNRTFKCYQIPVTMWGNYTPADCAVTGRRNYAQRLCLGNGVWYYDIFGSFYDHPIMAQILREEQVLWQASAKYPAIRSLNAQTATLRKLGNFNHRRMTTNEDLTQTHYWTRLEHFSYPVDDVYFRDLDNPELPDYKVYLVKDTIALNAEERAKLDTLKCDGNILVFQHVAGYSDWKTLDVKHISQATGINIIESAPGVELSDLAWKYADSNHPLIAGLKPGDKALRPKEYRAKRFAVSDPDAIPLGYYLDGGEVAAAVKKFDDWTAVYLPTELPPFEIQENLAKFAGVHSFTESDVTLRAGGRFVSVYCTKEHSVGEVKFPEKFAVYEIFSGKIIESADKVPFDLYRGDSLLFFLGTLEEVQSFADEVKASGAFL